MGQSRPLLFIFVLLFNTVTQIVQICLYKSVDDVLGIRTQDRRRVESTELSTATTYPKQGILT